MQLRNASGMKKRNITQHQTKSPYEPTEWAPANLKATMQQYPQKYNHENTTNKAPFNSQVYMYVSVFVYAF